MSAQVTANGKSYEGTIEMLSEDGLFEIMFPWLEVNDFSPIKTYPVKVHDHTDEDWTLLQCKIVWLRLERESGPEYTYCMGMEIISPPENL